MAAEDTPEVATAEDIAVVALLVLLLFCCCCCTMWEEKFNCQASREGKRSEQERKKDLSVTQGVCE